MVGTFAGALAAREIKLQPADLVADVTGEIEKEDGVLVIRRIRIRYRLRIPPEKREVAERVRAVHATACPVARSIGKCIEIGTEVEYI